VLHLDCYWQAANHWSDLLWDADNFPDPEAMLATLAGQGFRVCLWINSYISHLSPSFTEADAAGYFLKRRDGSSYVADVWHGSHPACGIVDFTNPEATAWFQGRLRTLLRQGAHVFKTDFAEGVPVDAVAHNGMTGAELHNVYSLMFNDIVADVTEEVAGHRMVWARSSFLGGQRHAAQWSGDSNCSFPSMASTLRGGLSHGLSGIPFWSHDAGGFSGTPDLNLYTRWAQFGALSPLVRFHGTTSRLPWDFPGAEADAIEALRLRYHLMPYLYSAAVESADTGLPMLRALLVDSPDDPIAWQADLEYRIGTDLLVAPMTDPDGTRFVYLPPGEDWVDWWSGSAHPGGRPLRVTLPLDQIPLFVRRGALLPVTDPTDYVGGDAFGSIKLISFGGLDATTVIRDVNGETTVTGRRDGDRYVVTVDGPATIAGVEFRGDDVPTEVTIA
jgi:alpha-D-xyloside xylohydrolase